MKRKYLGAKYRAQDDGDVEVVAIHAVAKYLESIGWQPLVGGFTRIERGGGQHKYRLVFGFTGVAPAGLSADVAEVGE